MPSEHGITMLVCDVTDESSVTKLIAEVVSQAGRIDVLVNNAGIGMVGGAEESSAEQAQRLFDVNVFGVIRVTNAVLPLMRSQGKGRIINLSSIVGLIPAPYNALYSATKHALEGYSEALDHEIRHSGIRVTLVEPGATNTPFEENLTRPDRPLPIYDAERLKMEALMREWLETGDAPDIVANVILHAATVTTPKLRYGAGRTSKLARFLRRTLPESIFDRIWRKLNKLPNK
jgi:short-subunit dehydrogenase